MSIAIERGVAIPAPRSRGHVRGRKPAYPFAALAVGESFTVPLTGEVYDGAGQSDKAQQRVMCAAANWKRRTHSKVAFTTRIDRDAGVVRCWRVA